MCEAWSAADAFAHFAGKCITFTPVLNTATIRYIYSTFPIVEREEVALHGRYRSRELCLAWINALMAGQPDADIKG